MHGINDEVTILTPNDITAALAVRCAVFLLWLALNQRLIFFLFFLLGFIVSGRVFIGALNVTQWHFALLSVMHLHPDWLFIFACDFRSSSLCLYFFIF